MSIYEPRLICSIVGRRDILSAPPLWKVISKFRVLPNSFVIDVASRSEMKHTPHLQRFSYSGLHRKELNGYLRVFPFDTFPN